MQSNMEGVSKPVCLQFTVCVVIFCLAVHSGGPMSSQPLATMMYPPRHPEMPQNYTVPPEAQPDTTQPPGMPATHGSPHAAPPLPNMQTHTGAPPPPTPAGSSPRVSNVLVMQTYVHTLPTKLGMSAGSCSWLHKCGVLFFTAKV